MIAVSESNTLVMYREKNCFTCENLVNEICKEKRWSVENGFAGNVYASTCTVYRKTIENQPTIIELC